MSAAGLDIIEIISSDDEENDEGEDEKNKSVRQAEEDGSRDFKDKDPCDIFFANDIAMKNAAIRIKNYKTNVTKLANKVFGGSKPKAFGNFSAANPKGSTEKYVVDIYKGLAKGFGGIQAFLRVTEGTPFKLYSKDIDKLIVHMHCK